MIREELHHTYTLIYYRPQVKRLSSVAFYRSYIWWVEQSKVLKVN